MRTTCASIRRWACSASRPSVALVGGLDSLGGVIPGALIVAAVEVLSVRYGDPLLADVSPFLCLLAMLLVRPWGLFGTREELERV